ncbi:MAG: class I SAM-dependent methyltransferase [Candidatus Margulisiibacteriota bacterium]|jgi:SAM-dependent methyltransferase
MKILNVGCGDQIFGTHFIDLYPQRENVIKCDVEKEAIPFPDNYFDEVYCENMLEHLKSPNKVLVEMLRVLKKKGKLTVITDNASFWAYHLGAKTHYGAYEKRSGETEDRHYALYTSWHLSNHFRSLNMNDIKIEYLLIPGKHSTKILVKLLSRIIGAILPHLGFPQIKITGVKQ